MFRPAVFTRQTCLQTLLLKHAPKASESQPACHSNSNLSERLPLQGTGLGGRSRSLAEARSYSAECVSMREAETGRTMLVGLEGNNSPHSSSSCSIGVGWPGPAGPAAGVQGFQHACQFRGCQGKQRRVVTRLGAAELVSHKAAAAGTLPEWTAAATAASLLLGGLWTSLSGA